MSEPIIVLAGPTGVGKTALSLLLAHRLGGEIVNYDSIQIYRGFDIGSAKPTPSERSSFPHHLFDIVDATDDYSAAHYQSDADRVCSEIRARGSIPILTGGTFFYLRALLAGLPEMPPKDERVRARLDVLHSTERGAARLRCWLERVDPVSASRIAPRDWHRTQRALEVHILTGRPISSWTTPGPEAPRRLRALVFGLQIDRETLRERLDRRSREMFRGGLIEETRALLSRYPSTARPFESIGYREAVRVVNNEMDIEAAVIETASRTRAYAKRQMTWLRSERDVVWLDAADSRDTIVETMVETMVARFRQRE